jgi:hypothetical protein
MDDLHVYIVGIRGEEEGSWKECTVAAAESPEHAISLVHPHVVAFVDGWVAKVVGDETDYSVERYPQADALATEPKVIPEADLRPFGWHYADEDECQGCGEYREDVCPECDLCPPCANAECEACKAESIEWL